jgi:hypothetical protein
LQTGKFLASGTIGIDHEYGRKTTVSMLITLISLSVMALGGVAKSVGRNCRPCLTQKAFASISEARWASALPPRIGANRSVMM